ncbi:MAG: isoprenylcysteine carboxylmethyltransferase family protein [Paracoccaceae bacterium]|nr:isoprenylcysteine carboxylmethyltransferase family protein [Paracoccaceae bacterium]
MRMLDLPPLWLALMIALMWAETRFSGGLPLPGWVGGLGWLLIALGIAVTVLALVAFLRARTSPIPHTEPEAILTTGLYAVSRNPIYLADAAVLLGAGLVLGAVSVVLLLPGFVALITRRFIAGEEARLAARFADDWTAYAGRVRRWL